MRGILFGSWAAVVVIGISCLSSARAEESPAVPGQISVVGEGTVETLPDLVEIDFTVLKVADSAEDGKAYVDKVVSNFLTACSDLSIDQGSITATDFNLLPRSRYDAPAESQKPEGYDVSRGITIRLTKLSSFNELVQRAIHAGVNGIGRIEMKASKERELREQATLAAVRDGRRQAEMLARETGRQLGAVSALATGDAQLWTGYTAKSRYISVHADSLPEFQPGPIKLSMRVFMTFGMK